MIFYPSIYLNNVKEITIELLKENNIKGLLLDVDNTLIDFNHKILDGVKDWCQELKKEGIKLCILSNTNKIEKVKRVAKELDLQYINFAKKPSKGGFIRAMELLELKAENMAIAGDQVMTDVLGGNRMKMFTILTKPLDKKDIFITRVKRPLENFIIKRYLTKVKKKARDKNVF